MTTRRDLPKLGDLLGRVTRGPGRPPQTASRPGTHPADEVPSCPACDRPMRLRVARRGEHVGRTHWGCTAFPGCRGLRELG